MTSNKNNSNHFEYTVYTMDRKEAGIIDPTKVTRVALEKATSVFEKLAANKVL